MVKMKINKKLSFSFFLKTIDGEVLSQTKIGKVGTYINYVIINNIDLSSDMMVEICLFY